MYRFVCIHGHFYQPPRENPWLEEVEFQESAHPYHDWNQRITAECYAPNETRRIMGPRTKVTDMESNYSMISFNFGPTLLSWMEKNEPEVYEGIIWADKRSMQRFSGHGSAIAQVYNHMIMPLSNERDKITQVRWGIADFQRRFGRFPEGMWLPEMAVDLGSLEVVSDAGMKFTILAPHQAARVKKIDNGEWISVEGGKVDPRRPYLCRLPSGRSINIFFRDEEISREVAFGDLLSNGQAFAERLLKAFVDEDRPQLVHIATDGETYGHHHRFGDKVLAYCLDHIASNNWAGITNYGEFLEKFPAEDEVQIFENTSWSCAHGIERWRSNCGCNSGLHRDWSQEWRQPLRLAMDWLADRLARIFEDQATEYLKDPWEARDDYVSVILNRSSQSVKTFIIKHAIDEVSEDGKSIVLKLLEMQRHAMLMNTSCGWFFDKISGIETVQVIQCAARAIQLAKEIVGIDLEPEYVKIIASDSDNLARLLKAPATKSV